MHHNGAFWCYCGDGETSSCKISSRKACPAKRNLGGQDRATGRGLCPAARSHRQSQCLWNSSSRESKPNNKKRKRSSSWRNVSAPPATRSKSSSWGTSWAASCLVNNATNPSGAKAQRILALRARLNSCPPRIGCPTSRDFRDVGERPHPIWSLTESVGS